MRGDQHRGGYEEANLLRNRFPQTDRCDQPCWPPARGLRHRPNRPRNSQSLHFPCQENAQIAGNINVGGVQETWGSFSSSPRRSTSAMSESSQETNKGHGTKARSWERQVFLLHALHGAFPAVVTESRSDTRNRKRAVKLGWWRSRRPGNPAWRWPVGITRLLLLQRASLARWGIGPDRATAGVQTAGVVCLFMPKEFFPEGGVV